jgi:hypothetical protein
MLVLISSGPSNVSLYLISTGYRVKIPIGSVHPPPQVRCVGEREERRMPVPATGAKPPGDAQQIDRESGIHQRTGGERERKTSP